MMSDEDDYRLLTLPEASLTVFEAPVDQRCNPDKAEVCIWGNRQGMASLASILLYLRSNSWRREFLSITGLHFVRRRGIVSLTIRIAADESGGDHGRVHLIDRGSQFEWVIGDDHQLLDLALLIHNLASCPPHNYDVVPFDEVGDALAHFQLTDVADRD